ncbi:recombinase RecT [Pseudovibrio exalbescens]|uniref:recombinase RecT n=1 Tax=Pseudovibrio exalbescens TaxID=197461 RepID=UPI0015E0AB0C|nr:recombinase RecT [Pseudovibrio exalbescens]
MSNELANIAERRAYEMYQARGSELEAALPSHVNAERFKRNVINAFKENPKLARCDGMDVFYEIMGVAALGLYVDRHLGEAYLIVGKGDKPQARLGYRGLIKLAKQSGEIKSFTAGSVRENDSVEFERGSETFFRHKYDLFADRGDLRAYYAVVKFANGETDFETMTVEETHKIRDRSDGWRAFKADKIKSTPWATDEEEMAKKTVVRRLIKRLPQSPEMSQAFQIDDREYPSIAQSSPRHSDLRERLAKRREQPEQIEGFSHAQETMPQDIAEMQARASEPVEAEAVEVEEGDYCSADHEALCQIREELKQNVTPERMKELRETAAAFEDIKVKAAARKAFQDYAQKQAEAA